MYIEAMEYIIKEECVVTDEGEGVQLVDMVYLRRKLTILN